MTTREAINILVNTNEDLVLIRVDGSVRLEKLPSVLQGVLSYVQADSLISSTICGAYFLGSLDPPR